MPVDIMGNGRSMPGMHHRMQMVTGKLSEKSKKEDCLPVTNLGTEDRDGNKPAASEADIRDGFQGACEADDEEVGKALNR